MAKHDTPDVRTAREWEAYVPDRTLRTLEAAINEIVGAGAPWDGEVAWKPSAGSALRLVVREETS